jgi:HEAT repeat protein
VVPLLRGVLANEDEHFDVRSAAAIALAKIGDASVAEDLRRLASAEGKGTHKVVVESAALALGLLEKDDAATRECLVSLAVDRERSGSFARPFSAISLGFLPAQPAAQASVRDALLGVVAGKEPGEDAKAACLLGLGLSRDAGSVPALVQMVRTSKGGGDHGVALEDVDIAFALDALGRIGVAGDAETGPTAVLDLLAERVGDAGASPHVRRSAILALGHVAPAAPAKAADRALDVLVRATDTAEDDSQVRNFALIALGRIGADKRTSDAARGRCIASLQRTLDKGRPANLVPPFAALGLALIGRAQDEAGVPVDEENIRKPIRAKFAETRDPATKAAFALASGLVRDRLAADGLLAALSDQTTPSAVRAYAALSLGLIGDERAVPAVRAALDEERDRELSLHSAIAAGLLGDAKAVERMVELLRDPGQSQYVLGSVAIALGHVGDERAVPPLCEIVKDAKRWPDLTRALAVVALGRLGDKRDVPTLARLSTDFNYRAQTPATRELLTIL